MFNDTTKLERFQQCFAAPFYEFIFLYVHFRYANVSDYLKMHNLLDRGITMMHCFFLLILPRSEIPSSLLDTAGFRVRTLISKTFLFNVSCLCKTVLQLDDHQMCWYCVYRCWRIQTRYRFPRSGFILTLLHLLFKMCSLQPRTYFS
jgi:hypothetical protein